MHQRMAARSGGDHHQRPPPLTFPPSFPHSTPFPHWISQNKIIKVWWLEVAGKIDFCFQPNTNNLYFRLHLRRASKRLARVITDKDTGRSRGFGFVNFDSNKSSSLALSSMDGQELQGRNICVSYANDRPSGPSSGYRGGFGSGSRGY